MLVDELYSLAQTTLGFANTRDSENTFLIALDQVIVDMNRVLGLSVSSPNIIDGSDIGYESYCNPVYLKGIKFYMQGSGAWAQDADPESFRMYDMTLKNTIASAINANDDFLTRNQED
jgi:hypothetical protein